MTQLSNHGYRFDGDFVYLNADVNFSEADLAAGAAWSLQLLASESGFSGNEPVGIRVAELAIEPMFGGITVNACCAAIPPAGAADQVLAMALLSTTADGLVALRDLGVYEARQNFCQPCLLGDVRCTLADGAARLTIEAIANPRGEDNLSGTLALEVWALDTPYAGGAWVGSPVASVVVGILGGGNQWTDCQYDVPAALPADGAALTVMLREWTPAGYVTRDYRNIAALPAKAKPTAKAKAAGKPKVAAKPKAAAKPVAAKAPKPEAKPVAAKSAAKAASKPDSIKVAAKPVSINKASEDDLAALKGLSREVARAIVAARPYAAIEDVCKAKGMGAKTLEKLRPLLAL
ncbi:helix-hairpin-helix domain-containing protein [Dechloromonas sp. HYN0024]|uniref:ComEA family DNA-binding protein n=1 Tax=Dechloromonas sp. HYN0024 TaxID=2231055 RepID=UPI0019673722|nr:helix-hairpin-helix domain-containing protein [Dechloromonas sp. HYN0024]